MSAAETGPVTVVEGTTFCLSSPTGDVVPGTSHGLFFRDARVLSRWELRLDGEAPHPLSVSTPDAYAARFVLRARDQLLRSVRQELGDIPSSLPPPLRGRGGGYGQHSVPTPHPNPPPQGGREPEGSTRDHG